MSDTVTATILYISAIAIFAVLAGKSMKRSRNAAPLPEDVCLDAAEHAYGPRTWTQDGWVRVCKLCRHIQYCGDDFDAGPER